PASLLVHRYEPDPRIGRERVLHRVAVMRVEIHVEQALDAAIEQPADGERRIVEVAEAAGAPRASVMGAAGGMKGDASRERELGRAQRAADAGRGALEQAGEQRVLHGADAE